MINSGKEEVLHSYVIKNKTILKNLCDIKFNLEELDILTKEVKGDKINNNGIKEDNSLINIKLNNDEIDILFN